MSEITHLEIVEIKPDPLGPKIKTKLFNVWNKDRVHLGRISFRPQWRKYVFEPQGPGIVFDAVCLEIIAKSLELETLKWRSALKVKSYKTGEGYPKKPLRAGAGTATPKRTDRRPRSADTWKD